MSKRKEDLKPTEVSQQESIFLRLIPGTPEKDGWYLVKLVPGHTECDRKYDVDYCRAGSKSDGGGREWMKWYKHNISHYAELPEE